MNEEYFPRLIVPVLSHYLATFGAVSLQDLFSQKEIAMTTESLTMEELTGLIVRVGWPYAVTHKNIDETLIPSQYLDAIINDDTMRWGRK